ncbi:MAG TPA: DUF262 domain-containing protein [Methylosinus sp.]
MSFEQMGIGDLLRRERHMVPPNQRSYAWEERNVLDLLQDINGEMNPATPRAKQEYFLGTIVLVDRDDGLPPHISDGQQRLATTSIILARIRDILNEIGDKTRAQGIDNEYLLKIDIDSAEIKTQISLNMEDNSFYADVILSKYPHSVSDSGFMRASNKRLLTASKTAYEFLKNMISGFADDVKAVQLTRWIRFIREHTLVVTVKVPDENQAFRLFETLNDRGVKASQVDILKNFFLQLSGDRLGETHAQWTELAGKIEANFPDKDDQMILYIRHLWITSHGHTIEKDLSTKIRKEVTSAPLAASFIVNANSSAMDYIALSDPSHPKWIGYKSATREYINTINKHLKVEQIKPLLFAIAMRFSPEETTKAFKFAVSISVRFLIYGGRGGFLDEHYAQRAHEIGSGRITRAKELRDSMKEIVPTDKQFEQAFAVFRVSKAYLSRYYLRAIDKTMHGDPNPEFVANDEYEASNLEHIIPIRPSQDYNISADELANIQQMIGNLTLISSRKNVVIGNAPFREKKEIYRESAYMITNDLEKYGDEFGVEQVKNRQAELAKLAVKTWSLSFE